MAQAGLRVEFVARPPQAEAIRRGIIIKQDAETINLKAAAVTSARELNPESSDVILLTTKSQATEAAIEEISIIYSKATPVICLQNGIRNEEIVARRVENVYAGLVFLSAVQLDPGTIVMPRGRTVAIGRYPSGVDGLASLVCDDLNRAGLEATLSGYVMAMKWGKLVANLNNATHAITGYWLERGLADPDMRSLMVAVREEGLRVLDRAGIAVEPPAPEPSPIHIRQMTEALKQPPKPSPDALNLAEDKRTHASMWQDLYLGRKTTEADFLNGEIVRLGKEVGIPTPYNSTLLEIINRMVGEEIKPGLYTPAELHALIRARG